MVATDEEWPCIKCPVCGMVSYNPNDIREGYCGNCHDWTTPKGARRLGLIGSNDTDHGPDGFPL